MTTRINAEGRKLSREEKRDRLAELIAERVAARPGIKPPAILRELRAEGERFSNDLGRALARAAVDALAGDIRLTVPLGGTGSVILAAARRTPARRAVARQLRALGATLGGDGKVKVELATHVAITYAGTVEVDVHYASGSYFYSRTISVRGRFVQPLEHFSQTLIRERIAIQAEGQFGRILTGGNDSFVEGLIIEVKDIRITQADAELRGGYSGRA